MILGVGNENRGDDGIGARVVRRIAELRPDLPARVVRADALSLLEAMEGQRSVVVVDAIRTGTRAGTVVRYDATHFPVQLGSRSTTHGLGVAEAIELGRSLGMLPRKIVVIGIEGSCFDLGTTPSPPLEGAVDEAIQKILEEVDAGT